MRHHHMTFSGTANIILKVITCTVGALLAVVLVVVGALAASFVATGIGTLGLARRAFPRRIPAAHEPVDFSEPIRPSETRRPVQPLAGCRSTALAFRD